MMSCNTPSIEQTNEAVELSFFSMDIQFSSRLSLICGAWVMKLWSFCFFFYKYRRSPRYMVPLCRDIRHFLRQLQHSLFSFYFFYYYLFFLLLSRASDAQDAWCFMTALVNIRQKLIAVSFSLSVVPKALSDFRSFLVVIAPIRFSPALM